MQHKYKLALATLLASTASIVFTTLLTIIGELQPGVKVWLKAILVHHWVGKGVLGLAVFILVWASAALSSLPADERQVVALTRALAVAAVVCVGVLYGYFWFEAFWA